MSSLSGAQRVISALAVYKARFGVDEAPKDRISSMAKVSSSTLPSLLSRMVKKGQIEYGVEPSTIKLTDKGMALAEPLDIPTSNEELHEELKKDLKGKSLRIFEFIADGKVYDKKDVMEAVECTNPKTFAPLVSRELRKQNLVHFPSKNTIQLTKDCFLFPN